MVLLPLDFSSGSRKHRKELALEAAFNCAAESCWASMG